MGDDDCVTCAAGRRQARRSRSWPMRIVVDNRRHAVVSSPPPVLRRPHRHDSRPCQSSEEPVFKRRKPDEPQVDEAGVPLPAGLSDPDQGDHPDQLEAPSRPIDNGLGVPPFRPAPPQEVQTMSRPPFTTAPAPPAAPPAGDRAPDCHPSATRRAIRRSAARWSSAAASACRAPCRTPNAWWSRALSRPP